MHVIDEDSPLYGMTIEDWANKDLIIVLILQGLDESTTQLMQARHVYNYKDVKWNHRYIDTIYIDEHACHTLITACSIKQSLSCHYLPK